MTVTHQAETLETARTLLTRDTFARDCPGRAVMDQVMTRWATLILAALVTGPHRFSALATRVEGVSQKMLSHNLKALVRAGLVHRAVEPTVPPQVTYSLTALGADLAGPLCALIHWFGANAPALQEAQARHDATR
ncbi:winged helix-turn-helix transcriptional regulator [Jidongwangia harbinensis]|uniref:winged helix-turn-helix transcriptional regulator n=1 Tax=Jidongwangia harbinensis TaxID=2878561 RepID=UPI001CD960B6|nr:helix-turn-helix domain-containing protein [Jidongwangia harbinensis]MCA2212303.1 helix-turn-helix transcriptional regulator [Jidongwangia harbinensis]